MSHTFTSCCATVDNAVSNCLPLCSHYTLSKLNRTDAVITPTSPPLPALLPNIARHHHQRKGWGANHGTPAAIDAVRQRFSGPSSTGTPFVAAGGGGYAATVPALSAQDTTESFDGGGFAPPASASRGNGNGNVAQVRSGSFGAEEGGSSNYPDGRDGGGYGGRVGGGAAGDSGIDDPLTRASQQQQHSPPPPPRWLEEQETAPEREVPSWLGRSSVGPSRRTGSATSGGRAPMPVAERQEQHQQREYQQQEYQQQGHQQRRESFEDAGGVWGEGSAGVEETTDWSNSGSVV